MQSPARKKISIQNAFEEIKSLKEQTEADCTYLREELESEYNFYNMIGKSASFKKVVKKIQQVASTDVGVYIYGESGTGKELAARAIHAASHRNKRPIVKVDCTSIPTSLIESELFGHEKGAFTDAHTKQIGRFELANGSTLFLDEIGELPLESQAKLLRMIEDGEFERLGSPRTIRVDVRVIACTNRNLEEEIQKGGFRQDLWYRLSVFPITVPPLRERKDDIPLLVNAFVAKASRKMGKKIEGVPAKVMQVLQDYHWPGNIRELENVIERAVITSQGPSLKLLDNLGASTVKQKTGTARSTLMELEYNHILQILNETGWRINGPKGAALILGINPSTLRSRMKKLGVQINRGYSGSLRQDNNAASLRG